MHESRSDAPFREEVRAWLRANLPADLVARSRSGVHPSREDLLGTTALLSRVGWSVPHWPVEHGGPGWTPMQAFVFEEELTLAGGPGNNIQGVSLVGPVLYTFGTPAQQARYLPAIREGREFWAQGFSEPNSGSDLASLRTSAVRDGDAWVVNGQKIWTSQAMMADMLFCLVRTDPDVKLQRGISFLLIDMKSPGITVRPIPSIDEGESLCEVFFDGVRVPLDNLVGEAGRGWDYAKFLLANERVQTAEVPRNKLYLARLREIAAAERRGGRPLLEDPVFRERIAAAEIELLGLESAVVGAIELQDASPLTPSALKIQGCELMQQQLGLQVEALGVRAAAISAHSGHALAGAARLPAHAQAVSAEFLFRRAATIYGGSSEIQKNIVSRLLFLGEEGDARVSGEDASMLRETASRLAQRLQAAVGRRAEAAQWFDASGARWQAFAESGLAAVGLPESCGGFGGPAELAAVCEALGEGLAGEAFLGLAVLPGQLLASLGDDAGLAGVADGSARLALAHEEPPEANRDEMTRVRREGGRCWLEGRKCAVSGGALATAFLVTAREDDGGLSVLRVAADAPGLTREVYRLIDGQGVADLELSGVVVDEHTRVGAAGAAGTVLESVLDLARVLACAEALGAMTQSLRITRDYLATRRQFGSPLSEFQALRHRLAEMFAEIAVTRALVRRAIAAQAGDDRREAHRLATACKARTGRAAQFVGNQSVQLHGGIGMTEDYVIGRYYKRLFCFQRLLGDTAWHTRHFAALVD